jgi:Berberine and berberine like
MFAAQSPAPDDGVALAAWSTGFRDAPRPHALPGGYANFLMDEGLDAARGCYGSSAGRLAVLKGRYDPANVFRRNQNILPTIGAASTASVHGGPDPRLRANRPVARDPAPSAED